MGDLQSPVAIWAKGILFVVLGLFASALLLTFAPDWRVGLLLALSIWAFCRAYYFAFYVIEHYVDPGYKFAGLIDFARYATGRPRS
ncbi:hypothetical protein [Blastopirellula marina]|uniref:Uncharacterized protein n=1 Tax=Blastopirellula marina TaxID=124 RepID=A0A2S8F2U6_9BACT|nr:hypothetical protein [Blastopirellula marina]PQO26463.1 hypothetical protein C5Y98_30460 [Blastopirellula marina]PQO46902.1 hypothetical protein C5Y93_07050 [Blastopirellula marina]PTL40776.1 hypothetical protein C5Y97_30475 [Blastopirellula marina]